jgi:hypothetical protein
MNRNNNALQLGWLIAGIPITVAAMLIVVFLASRRPSIVMMPAGGGGTVTAQAPGEAPPSGDVGVGETAQPAGPPPEVKVVRVPALPPITDPFAPDWDKAPFVELPLQPQQTAPPMLDAATVSNIRVQALRDDKRIAWRLSWTDDSPSANVEVSKFADAVAIQMPLVDNAPFTMGGKGQPVRLIQWKAAWQKDLDEGFQDVAKLYPNARSDLFWSDVFSGLANGTIPGAATDEFAKFRNDETALLYSIGVSAGNPISDQHRTQPVEELSAEGFGSSTHVSPSSCTGRGVWRDGRWTVVLDHALDAADPLTARLLGANVLNQISLAVWDGSAGNTGGRKHYFPWIPMKVEP